MEAKPLWEQVKDAVERSDELRSQHDSLQEDLTRQRRTMLVLVGKLHDTRDEHQELEARHQGALNKLARADKKFCKEKNRRKAARSRIRELETALEESKAKTDSATNKAQDKGLECSTYRCAFLSAYKLVRTLKEQKQMDRILECSRAQCRRISERKERLEALKKSRSPERVEQEADQQIKRESSTKQEDSDSDASLSQSRGKKLVIQSSTEEPTCLSRKRKFAEIN